MVEAKDFLKLFGFQNKICDTFLRKLSVINEKHEKELLPINKMRRNDMKMTAILKIMVKGFLMSLGILGLFAVAANAQPGKTKKYIYKIDKSKISFATPTFELPSGKIIVSGEVKEIDVSGGSGGCYTITVGTYRITPNGEKVLVRSRSKRICKIDRLPEIVIEQIPQGKYLVEIEIDRPQIGEGKLGGELVVTIQPERINPK